MFVDSLPSFVSSNSCVLAQLNNRRTFLITTAAAAALQEKTLIMLRQGNSPLAQIWQAVKSGKPKVHLSMELGITSHYLGFEDERQLPAPH